MVDGRGGRVAATARSVGDRIGRNVVAIAGVVRALALAGLAAGLVVWAALLPWVLRLPGDPAVPAVVAGALLLALVVPPVTLLRHGRELCEVYGDRTLLQDEIAALGADAGDAYRRLLGVESARPTGKLALLRWAWRYLRELRAIWQAGLGVRVERLTRPIDPVRLARSAWLGLGVLVLLAVAAPVVLASVLLLVLGA